MCKPIGCYKMEILNTKGCSTKMRRQVGQRKNFFQQMLLKEVGPREEKDPCPVLHTVFTEMVIFLNCKS